MSKHTTRARNGHGLIRNDFEKLKAIIALTAKDMRGQARNALSESYENLKDTATDLQENVAVKVRKKPYKAITIAAALGLVLGGLMRGKRVRVRHR
jgi:ElaB/YqjD/DUF883 family membrane-anchored ribosome-binding protein